MKRFFTIICFVSVLFSMCTPVFASENQLTILSQEIDLGNGITVFKEVKQMSGLWSTDKVYALTNTYRQAETVIAVITITATFRYNGTTVSVVSKSVDQTDTYSGWSYKQNSFTSNGGTVTLDAKLTKLLFLNIPVTMTIVCDKDGNITLP